MDTLLEILNVIGHSLYWIVITAGGLAAVVVYLSLAIIVGAAATMGCKNMVTVVIFAVLWPVWIPLAILENWLTDVWTEQTSKISRFMARRKKVCVQRTFHARLSYRSGTVKELSEKVFKDYLESGWKLNHCVNRHPDTGEALVNALNRCSELHCPSTRYVVEPRFSLVPEVPKEAKARRP